MGMKNLQVFLIIMIISVLTVTSMGQNKYAILVGGPIDKSHWFLANIMADGFRKSIKIFFGRIFF